MGVSHPLFLTPVLIVKLFDSSPLKLIRSFTRFMILSSLHSVSPWKKYLSTDSFESQLIETLFFILMWEISSQSFGMIFVNTQSKCVHFKKHTQYYLLQLSYENSILFYKYDILLLYLINHNFYLFNVCIMILSNFTKMQCIRMLKKSKWKLMKENPTNHLSGKHYFTINFITVCVSVCVFIFGFLLVFPLSFYCSVGS